MTTQQLKSASTSFADTLKILVDWMHIHSMEDVERDPWEWYREELDEAFDYFVANVFPHGTSEAQLLANYERQLAEAEGRLRDFNLSQKREHYPQEIQRNELIQKAMVARLLALKLVDMHVADPNLINVPPRNWPLASERHLVDNLNTEARWFAELGNATTLPKGGTVGDDKKQQTESQQSGEKLPEWSAIKSPAEWCNLLHWSESTWTKKVKKEPKNFRHEMTSGGKKNFKKVAIRNTFLSHHLSRK